MSARRAHSIDAFRDALTGRPASEVLDDLASAIRKSPSFLIATHVNPDGDAVGSASALCLGLRALGKQATVVVGEAPPEKLSAFIPTDAVDLVSSAEAARSLPPADWCVLLDTSEPDRAGIFKDRFFAPGQKRMCLDHHPSRAPSAFDLHLVVKEAPATGDLVLALLDRLGVEPSTPIAQALWIAIATDTGWFRFENASPWAFRDASTLASAGLDLPRIYSRVYEQMTLGRTRVLGRALSGLRSELDGAFVWSLVSRADLEAEGVTVSELDGVVDFLKSVRGARVAALIVEVGSDSYKASLRAPGDLEVESIARAHGGGGHAKAAGFRHAGRLEELVSGLRARISSQMRVAGPPA